MSTITTTTPAAPRSALVRNTWLAVGGVALAVAGLAAGLAWRPAPQSAPTTESSVEATKASLASNEAVVDTPVANKPEGTPVPKAASPTAGHAPVSKPAHKTAPETHASHGATTPLDTQPAAVCGHCGVIEGVRELTVKGKGTGLGAVAGGVLGGAVGNQVGKGGGRTAMTVLGAIGGGLAGNEIEKRQRSETVYEVRVRMDDGSVRSFQQKTAPTPGSRVTVDGNTLHVTRSGGGDGQMMKTSTGA